MTNLPEVVNNRDLNQHFLYSYQHVSKIGPNDKMKYVFADDLIFDRSRKSIFTQFQEFGYISDSSLSISSGSYDTGYYTISTYEGEINTYQYIPWHFTDFDLKLNNILEVGKATSIGNATWRLSGSDYAYYRNESNTPSVREITCEYIQFSYKEQDKDEVKIIPDSLMAMATPYMNLNSTSIPASVKLFISSSLNITPSICGYLDINIFIKDSELKYYSGVSEYSDKLSFRYEVANYVKLTKFKGQDCNTYFDNAAWLKKDGMRVYEVIESQSVLTNDWGMNSYIKPIQCTSKTGEYYLLSVPKRLIDREIIYGNLNNGCAVEFRKTPGVMNVITSSFDEYNHYLATGTNWDGHELTFNSKTGI